MGKIDPEDIVGKKYNLLTVEHYEGIINRKKIYSCKCECGTQTLVERYNLISGHTTSCGCSGRVDVYDLIGKNYGKLTVLKYTGYRNRQHFYECMCECGNITETTRSSLISGHTKTCGACSRIVKEDDYYRYIDGRGRSFVFDERDLPLVEGHTWTIDDIRYVYTIIDGKQYTLSRLIMSPTSGECIDHVNGDTFDNRRSNLRYADKYTNTQNVRMNSLNTTGYKGVTFKKSNGKYCARITAYGKRRHLGYFDDPVKAAEAYDEAARKLHGEFACVNFPREGERGCRPAEVFPLFDVYEDFEDLDAVV